MEMTQEFFDCLKWSGAAFVCGICLREWGYDSIGKWIGRANVAASLFVMSAFGLHSVRECSTLIQLVETKNVHEIASAAVVTGYEIKTTGGNVVSWRGPGPLSATERRSGRSSGGRGFSYHAFTAQGDGIDAMPNAANEPATNADAATFTGQNF